MDMNKTCKCEGYVQFVTLLFAAKAVTSGVYYISFERIVSYNYDE